MKNVWRFLLGGAIGLGLGYTLVLLIGPLPRSARRRPASSARPREEQPVG